MLQRLASPAFWLSPVDNSPLIFFRIFYGLILSIEAFGALATGWVERTFIEPSFTFTFIGFEFLEFLAVGQTANYVYFLLGILGVGVTLGAFYRASIFLYALLWTMVYLAQKTSYNNHYYLMLLLNWAFVFLPANAYASFDARRRPSLKSLSCPRWCHLFFIFLLFIVYTFASIAKIYPDWLRGDPIEIWFSQRSNYPIIGQILQQKWLQFSVAYIGIGFDLLIVPLLLWRRTRLLGVVLSFFFHLSNSIIFQIGTFPYTMLGALVFFFPADTIRRLFFKNKPPFLEEKKEEKEKKIKPSERLLLIGLAFFFVFQIGLPLRQYCFAGNTYWTEEGHFLAWRMMLRSKSGYLTYIVKDSTSGKSWRIAPTDYVTPRQQARLATRPDMIWQLAQRLKKEYKKKGYDNISIYVEAYAQLNKRPMQRFIDPTVDLANVSWQPFRHSTWIVALQ